MWPPRAVTIAEGVLLTVVLCSSCCCPSRSQIIFIRPNSFLHDSRWADGTAVTAAVVKDTMAAGNTVVIHNIEIYWKAVGAEGTLPFRAEGDKIPSP